MSHKFFGDPLNSALVRFHGNLPGTSLSLVNLVFAVFSHVKCSIVFCYMYVPGYEKIKSNQILLTFKRL